MKLPECPECGNEAVQELGRWKSLDGLEVQLVCWMCAHTWYAILEAPDEDEDEDEVTCA